MNTKHTPGPWAANDDGLILEQKSNLGITRVVGIRSGLEHEANARLIAAAPELLAALVTILAKEKGWDNGMCPLCFAYAYRKAQSDPHKPECPYEIAGAAIAKATGAE